MTVLPVFMFQNLSPLTKSHPNIKGTSWMSGIWGCTSPEIFLLGTAGFTVAQLPLKAVSGSREVANSLFPPLFPLRFSEDFEKKLHHAFMSTENVLPALQWKAQNTFASSTTQRCSRFRRESCKPDTLPLSGARQLAFKLMWSVVEIPYYSQTLKYSFVDDKVLGIFSDSKN